jgi:carboxyl-terminal processing protease
MFGQCVKNYWCRILKCGRLAIVLCCSTLLKAQPIDDQLALTFPRGPDAVPLLHEVWEFGAANIYPPALAARFDAETLERLESSLRSPAQPALADVLNPFLDSLGVSHTRFYDRRHQAYYMLRSLFSTREPDAPELYTIGVQLNDRSPGEVSAVHEGSAAAESGIARGDRIVAVDGIAFESLLQWQRADSVRITIDTISGQRDVSIVPVRQGLHRALARATAASRRVVDCGYRRFMYLHLWSGTHDVFLNILENAVAGARAESVDGFILDLRDGYGGAWWPYLDPFFVDRETYFTATRVGADGESEVMKAEQRFNGDAWDGPMAVLINGGTRSGKESLAYQFRKTGRAKLFGDVSSGAFTAGQGGFADRDVDFMFYLSVFEMRLDGTVIEGVGVTPDVGIRPVAGKDLPLAAALIDLGCQADP